MDLFFSFSSAYGCKRAAKNGLQVFPKSLKVVAGFQLPSILLGSEFSDLTDGMRLFSFTMFLSFCTLRLMKVFGFNHFGFPIWTCLIRLCSLNRFAIALKLKVKGKLTECARLNCLGVEMGIRELGEKILTFDVS